MTLFEILTRSIPYSNNSDVVATLQILQGKVPSVPFEFQNHPLFSLLEKCWKLDPKQRSSSSELLKQIENLESNYNQSSKIQFIFCSYLKIRNVF